MAIRRTLAEFSDDIATADIADDAVTGDKLAADAVGTAELANDVAISTTGAIAGTGGLTIDGATIFNETSADVDFRVESNGQTHMLFVDGGTDSIGICDSTPDEKLCIGDTATGGQINMLKIQSATVYTKLVADDNVGFSELAASHYQKFSVGGTEKMRMLSTGRMWLGNNIGSPEAQVTIETDNSSPGGRVLDLRCGDYDGLKIISNGNATNLIDIRLKNNDVGFQVQSGASSTGNIKWKNGDLHSPSDGRFKKDITDLEYGLDAVNQMRGVRFKWKVDNDPWLSTPDDPRYQAVQVGFIAQELEAIAPELVNTCVSDDTKTIKNNTLQLSAILVNAIKELSAKNDALETKVTALETANTALEARVLVLENA